MRVTPPDIAVPDGRNGGRVIALIGILLSIVVVIDPLVRSGSVWFPEFIIEMTLSAMLIYVGYRLTRSDIDAKTLQKVDVSCFKGMLALGGFAAGVIVTAKVSGWHISNPYFLVQTMVTSGALLGLVIGVAGVVAPLRPVSKGGASNESNDDSSTSGTGTGSTTPSGSTDLPNATGSADSNDSRPPLAADTDSPELPVIPEDAIATDGIQAPSGVVDDWLEVLADRNCRYVLRMAMNSPDGVLTIDELTATDELRKRSLETQLRHITLPKLWDLHLIDYDDRTGTIRYDSYPAFENLFETVERYRE